MRKGENAREREGEGRREREREREKGCVRDKGKTSETTHLLA